jgi:hypothetical protein
MTKAELLADIAAKCGGEILATECVETIGDVKRYISNVFTTGQDADAGPIAQKRNINWYVYKEGEGEEAAYYSNRNWQNPEDKDPTGSTLLSVQGIYQNHELRKRVTGAICKNIRTTEDDIVSKEWAANNDGVLNLFMAWVASNATIQSNGGAASDSDLEYVVVTEAWSNVATALAL